MSDVILVNKNGAVLSRHGTPPGELPGPMFWMSASETEATAYRFAVRFPANAAAALCLTYEAQSREVPARVLT